MATRAAFTSALAEELAEDVLERFLRYVRIDTQSAFVSDTYPSTLKQLDLCRLLVEELREAGLEDAELTEHGYVFATLPGTVDAPVVGLNAHVDTSPDAPGAGVQPQVIRGYEGGPLVLPGDPSRVLDPEESPALAARVGHDIVTSDGTTLLGADDKAGIAEIMAAVAHLARTEGPRAPVRVAFTVDEEVAGGTTHFDIARFGADVAYTLDGSDLGELEIETFSAYEATVTIRGHSVHPGTAKGLLVNSLKLAADLIAGLPRDRLSPETTEGYEGFVHPTRMQGNAERTTITFILRDHDDEKLQGHCDFLRSLVDEVAAREPRAQVSVEFTHQYANMRKVIDRFPRVISAAEEAMRRAGVEPRRGLIRGGTDGARMSEMGLPTPNIFTGGQNYHSVKEWASVQDMAAADQP
ncbi:MAG TPA: peptidase T, partial [Gaiellaceae bacterium]|nr:peptidase T [Gaiellaceae bacterium]